MMRTNRWALAAICTATFMLLLDITIVQVALPSIQHEFGGGLSGLQWTIDAYALALAALIVAAGRTADRFGRRRIFLAGVAVFSAGSLACGLAPGLATLDAARVVQGVGGSAMFATALALIGQQFDGPARGRAIATWGATVGAGVASGPLLGGALVDAFSWRWVFLVNIPIGLGTLLLGRLSLTEGRDPSRRRFDASSVVLLSAGLGLFVAGLLRGSEARWHGAFGAAATGCGLALLAAFALRQRHEGTLFGPELFRNRAFRAVSVSTLALGAGMFGMFVYLTILLQNVLGFSPFGGGLRMLPMTALVFVVPLVMRRLHVPVVSGPVLAFGLATCAVGLFALTAAGATTSWWRLLPGLLLCGVGIGVANPVIAATGLAVVPPTRSGLAAGVSNTCRIAGLAVGIAGYGVLLDRHIDAAVGGGTASRLAAAGELHAAAANFGAGGYGRAAGAFDGGLHLILVAGGVMVLLGAAVAARSLRGLGAPEPAGGPVPQAQPVVAAPLPALGD